MAKTIMLMGTASGVGKSTLAIGLCRVLKRRGRNVAPFKPQNLSNNAHVFQDGRQMARSQALAALACGVEPNPDMNPVLLKPYHGGCEIFLDGVRSGTMDRAVMKEEMLSAYRRLEERCDVIVAEGAGSPVELNLRRGDIANMGFALEAKCPVILVADIRRGGMFAAAYGTVALLEPRERALVKGIIVNDFYGDPESFREGCEILEKITGVKVLGVVPHLELHLEDEDDLPGAATQTRERISSNLPQGMDFEAYQLAQMDALAEQLEKCLDMAAIEAMLK